MSIRTAHRIGFSFEYLMWIFTRISGLALFFLTLLGLIGAFVLGARTQLDMSALIRWTFFPNPNHVVNTSIADVALGWANAWWQVMQMLILFFGVSHGLNGLRVIFEDYIGTSWSRPMMRGFIFLFWLFILIVGVYVILAS